MSSRANELWTKLQGSLPDREELTAGLAAPEETDRLLGAIDTEGRHHFLVRLGPNEAALEDHDSKGLSVLTRRLALKESEPASYIDIICHDQGGNDAFDLIGRDILLCLVQGHLTPAACVSAVLAKWRRFWGAPRRQLLSREEQIGLFAEIWFLSTWLLPHLGPGAVERWRGPYGARLDFQWRGAATEVKATLSSRGRVHRIHGIDQLLPPEGGKLLLFSLRLREEPGATNSLPELIEHCRARMANDDASLAKLDAALVEARYSPLHEEEYRRLRLSIIDELLYRVEENFPRITVAELSGTTPPGVEYLEYDINLGGFEGLILAHRSDQEEFRRLL